MVLLMKYVVEVADYWCGIVLDVPSTVSDSTVTLTNGDHNNQQHATLFNGFTAINNTAHYMIVTGRFIIAAILNNHTNDTPRQSRRMGQAGDFDYRVRCCYALSC